MTVNNSINSVQTLSSSSSPVFAALSVTGAITTAAWNGQVVGPSYGGTGVNNGTKLITLGGSLTTSGAFNTTFTMTGDTNVTFPTSGTLATTGGSVASLTGTANQILVNGTSGAPQTGALTLTLPQAIATSSSPTFAGGTITGLLSLTHATTAEMQQTVASVLKTTLFSNSTTANLRSVPNIALNLGCNNATVMTLLGTNVGIQQTNPTTAKLVIGGTGGAEGLDLATSDQYANLRVLRNSLNASDKHMYIGFGGGATSDLNFYSNNTLVMRCTAGNSVIVSNGLSCNTFSATTISASSTISTSGTFSGGTFSGTFTGNGASITSLNPSNLTSAGATSGMLMRWNGSNWIPDNFLNGATQVLSGSCLKLGSFIIQFGQIAMGTDSQSTLTMPISFTSINTFVAVASGTLMGTGGGVIRAGMTVSNIAPSQIRVCNDDVAQNVNWICIGW